MFESAELGHKISKEVYKKEAPALRSELLKAQYQVLEAARFPVVVLVNGVDGAGKGETVNLLNEWMDPRLIHTHAMGAPTDYEVERPPMWRFWRELPPKGKIGIFFGSWYTTPILDRVAGRIDDAQLEHQMEDIVRFERMLADEGALLLKFWFHLAKKVQKVRLKTLEKNPETRWRVTQLDWKRFKRYDDFRKVSEIALRETSTAPAPWVIVEGADDRYRSLTVGRSVLDAMTKKLAEVKPSSKSDRPPRAAQKRAPPVDGVDVLRALDLGASLPKRDYDELLEEYSGRLNKLFRNPKVQKNRAVVGVFEGMDAAGKGGSIRRITRALDARSYKVIPIAAPTDEERAQPYLWRFWRHAPRRGDLTIFDRSWYGRVLVERVEGFCDEAAWSRAYGEINDFEEQLVKHGIVVVKFWLQISLEEQLKRFQEREEISFKQFKITPDDYRNRKKWPDYELAVCDMVDRTSTELAPWTLVESNDKNYARIKVMRTVCERIEQSL